MPRFETNVGLALIIKILSLESMGNGRYRLAFVEHSQGYVGLQFYSARLPIDPANDLLQLEGNHTGIENAGSKVNVYIENLSMHLVYCW